MNIVNRIIKGLSCRGLLGKSKKNRYYMMRWPDSSFMHFEKKINERAVYIKNNYKEIRPHFLWSPRIGELIRRFLAAEHDASINKQNGILDVFIATDIDNANKPLLKMMGRVIDIIDDENYLEWEQLLLINNKIVNYSFLEQYEFPEDKFSGYELDIEHCINLIKLTDEEEAIGKMKLEKMGIKEPFVCINARDSAYLNEDSSSKHTYRNTDINAFTLAAKEFKKYGITFVRMGRKTACKAEFDNVVDYSNKYYDEFMDIYLLKHCMFYLGDANGLGQIPELLGTPCAYTNYNAVLAGGFAGLVNNPDNFFITKLYFVDNEKRFMTVSEMFEFDLLFDWNGDMYKDHGISLFDNSQEEIYDFAVEMYERVIGSYVEDEEAAELSRRYNDTKQLYINNSGKPKSVFIKWAISGSFLMKYKNLL